MSPNFAASSNEEDCKVQGMRLPLFKVGLTQEDLLAWSDDMDGYVLLSKGGSSLGTEDISMADQTKEQREANYIHFGLIIVSLKENESVRTRLRQALRARGEENHGALARRILLTYHRDLQHEEQSELRTMRDEMLKGVFDINSSPEQIEKYVDGIRRCDRQLYTSDRLTDSQLASQLRDMMPSAAEKAWDETKKELIRLGRFHNSHAVVAGMQDALKRTQAKKRQSSARRKIPLGDDGTAMAAQTSTPSASAQRSSSAAEMLAAANAAASAALAEAKNSQEGAAAANCIECEGADCTALFDICQPGGAS